MQEALFDKLQAEWKKDSQAQKFGQKFSPWIASKLEQALPGELVRKASRSEIQVGSDFGALKDSLDQEFGFVRKVVDPKGRVTWTCELDQTSKCDHVRIVSAYHVYFDSLEKILQGIQAAKR